MKTSNQLGPPIMIKRAIRGRARYRERIPPLAQQRNDDLIRPTSVPTWQIHSNSESGVGARLCSVVAVVPFWLNSFSRNPFGYLNRYDSYGQSQRSPSSEVVSVSVVSSASVTLLNLTPR